MLKGTVEDLLANRLDVDMKLTSTSSSIVVNVETKEGYPTSYSYEITGPDDYSDKVNNTTENTHSFDKLNLNTEYSIKVIVKNKAGLTKEITKTIKTELVLEPELENLIPVVYKDNNWVVVDPTKDKWYDYSNKQWANAVLLRTGVSKTEGDIVTVEGDNSEAIAMFVWIPRYEYKIEGPYGKGGVSAESPGEIDVNFILKDTAYKDANSSGYRVHPAFTFGTEELSGIWIGKFETSHTTLSSSTIDNNLGCVDNNCSNADGIRVLPNVESLRYNNISNFFYAAQSMDNRLSIPGDLHMIKNSEWGAVAYLSQSKYGINKEITRNDNNKYLTGGGNYITNTNQSTTGNITGIYDMSGGTWEYVMGVLNQDLGESGFKNLPDSKYYDSYTSTISKEACSGGICYGQSLSETTGWYDDLVVFVSSSRPWLARGGSCGDETGAGIFATHNGSGVGYSFGDAFHVALTPTT